MKTPPASMWPVVLILTLIAVLAGCVGLEKRQVDAAREALDECEAEHGPDNPECKEIRLRLRDAQERYEEKARRAWVCDPTQDECPTRR